MPLTPADVANVAFSKPPIGKRGYHEDEVDAFLDLLEAELAGLIEENKISATTLSSSISNNALHRSILGLVFSPWSRLDR